MRSPIVLQRCAELLGESVVLAAVQATPVGVVPGGLFDLARRSIGISAPALPAARSWSSELRRFESEDARPFRGCRQVVIALTSDRLVFLPIGALGRPQAPVVEISRARPIRMVVGETVAAGRRVGALTVLVDGSAVGDFVVAPPHRRALAQVVSAVGADDASSDDADAGVETTI